MNKGVEGKELLVEILDQAKSMIDIADKMIELKMFTPSEIKLVQHQSSQMMDTYKTINDSYMKRVMKEKK